MERWLSVGLFVFHRASRAPVHGARRYRLPVETHQTKASQLGPWRARTPRALTPISWELRQVLAELKEEQKKVINLGNLVFTRPNGRPIKSIREALEWPYRRQRLITRPNHFSRVPSYLYHPMDGGGHSPRYRDGGQWSQAERRSRWVYKFQRSAANKRIRRVDAGARTA